MVSNFKNLMRLNKNKNINALDIVEKVKQIVTKNNNDGFGMTTATKKDIYYYKQLNTYLKMPLNVGYDEEIFEKNPNYDTNMPAFNEAFFSGMTFATFHGRTSTNSNGLEYCHPFNVLDKDKNIRASLVHNGVIDISHEAYEEISDNLNTTNDSEELCQWFNKTGMAGLDEISGYYAFYNVYKSEKGEILCKVVRDDVAPQFAVKIDGVYMLATSQDMLKEILSYMLLHAYHTEIVPVKDNISFDFSIDGKIINKKAFEPVGYFGYMTAKQSLAFKDYNAPKVATKNSERDPLTFGSNSKRTNDVIEGLDEAEKVTWREALEAAEMVNDLDELGLDVNDAAMWEDIEWAMYERFCDVNDMHTDSRYNHGL